MVKWRLFTCMSHYSLIPSYDKIFPLFLILTWYRELESEKLHASYRRFRTMENTEIDKKSWSSPRLATCRHDHFRVTLIHLVQEKFFRNVVAAVAMRCSTCWRFFDSSSEREIKKTILASNFVFRGLSEPWILGRKSYKILFKLSEFRYEKKIGFIEF